LSYFGSNHF